MFNRIKTHHLGILLMLAVLLTAVPAVGETELIGPGASTGIMTLGDCLDTAYENNIGLKQVQLGIELSALDRIRNESFFDPGFQLDLSAQGTDSNDPLASTDHTDRFNLSAKYTRPVWNGSSWVFSFDQGRSSSRITTGDVTGTFRNYSSSVGVSYNFPLMEGSGTRINRIGVERADLGIERSEIAVSETRRNLRYGIIQAYIQSVLAVRQMEVLELSLGTTENLVDEVQARINVGQLAEYELLAAQAGLAERQEALINSASAHKTLLDNLKELIGLPLETEINVDPSILRPAYLDTDPEDLFIIAQRNRGDLRDLDLRIQQAQLDLLVASDHRQDSLMWSTSMGIGAADDQYAGSVSDLDDFSWYTGLQYNLALGGNRRDEVGYESAVLAIDQLELGRIDYLRNLQLDIRQAHENLQNALLRINVTAQGLEVQEVKMESEMLRLEMGLITSRDLLEFDLELANARLSHDNAIADALNAVARIEYLTGEELLDDAMVLSDISDASGSTF